MICINCRLNLYNVKTRKKLKIYIIVRIKLSINENTQKPEKKTVPNLLGISEKTHTIY